MTLKITWYGHACFLIEAGKTKLLTDPFITGNPLSPVQADGVEADYILVSHGHGDHVGDTLDIATRTGATVISNYEIQNWIVNQGFENIHPQHIGGGFECRTNGRPLRADNLRVGNDRTQPVEEVQEFSAGYTRK